mgnify:CR=1 FL=1
MKASRPSFLLVDGNNIIHSWPDLLAMHRRRKGSAHSELTSRLESSRDFTGDRVVIVFDGKGAITQEERREDGLQIFYTSESHTADDIIERLAIRYADTYDITVATDDRAEQDIVVGAGGSVLSSIVLRDILEAAGRSMRDWIARHRKR